MSNTTVKLQIPLDKTLRDQVARHARSQGFSSIQDFTRVLYSAAIRRNMKVDFTADEEQLSPEAADRLDRLAEEAIRDDKAGKLKRFDNAEDALNYLHNL